MGKMKYMKSLMKNIIISQLNISSVEELIKKVSPYDFVSFDIFDTLLKRDVPSPEDVFSIVEKKTGQIGFAHERIHAEVRCRHLSTKEEITLDDIYLNIDAKYVNCKRIELEVENLLLKKNLWFDSVYNYCRQHNKTILVTSDMYLPQEFIEKILKREGILYDYLFLSSTEKVQKRTGNLFKRELNVIGISPKQLIHIGDSLGSDWIGAKKAGIKSLLIPRKVCRTSVINKKLDTYLDCFINNNIPEGKDYCWQLGYAALGPLLYGFITWLHTETEKRGLKKIYFFSRDGWLMKEAWDAIYGPHHNVQYMYISRRSVSVPILWKHSNWHEIGNFMTMTRFFTVKVFLKRLGIDVETCIKYIEACGLTPETVFSEANYLYDKRLEKLYNIIKNRVIENSKQEYIALGVYLKKMEFYGSVAVVDIGWNGSMQKNLEETLREMGIDAIIDGFYFGVKKSIPKQSMHGYLYDTKRNKLEATIASMQGMFESFFLAKAGSTRKYYLDDKKICVDFYEPEYTDNDPERIAFSAIQEGALHFIAKYKNSKGSNILFVKKVDYIANVLRFGTMPSQNDIRKFGTFRFYDTNVVYMANPKKINYYIIHPKQFFREFSNSVWKQAFLLKLFRIPFPWFGVLYGSVK